MPPFRFRAQAALDLRRRQDEEAERALGEARRAVAAAEAAVAAARLSLEGAMRGAHDALVQGLDPGRRVWHRHWIVRNQQVYARLTQQLADRRAAEERMLLAAMRARQRLRSLERLQDRGRRAHEAGERRAEQREFDMLGTLRHHARPSALA